MIAQDNPAVPVGSDDVRLVWIDSGMAEPDNWLFLGALFDATRWEEVGRRNSRIPERHANSIRLWRLRQP